MTYSPHSLTHSNPLPAPEGPQMMRGCSLACSLADVFNSLAALSCFTFLLKKFAPNPRISCQPHTHTHTHTHHTRIFPIPSLTHTHHLHIHSHSYIHTLIHSLTHIQLTLTHIHSHIHTHTYTHTYTHSLTFGFCRKISPTNSSSTSWNSLWSCK
jgi:hypothetical protein